MVKKKKPIVVGTERPAPPRSPLLPDGTAPNVRALRKGDLGGAIFGCKHSTMNECISKQLFGLPSGQFSWVRNIGPSLPLFLFNFSNRMLHGVYEAVSPGEMNIDPYAWTDGAKVKTPFPAQVRFRMREQYSPLPEKQFYDAIKDNYYGNQYFWFELDHTQTTRLLSLFKLSTPRTKIPQPPKLCPFPESVLAKGKGPSKPAMSAGGSKRSWGSDYPPLCSKNPFGDLNLDYGNQEDKVEGNFEELVSNQEMDWMGQTWDGGSKEVRAGAPEDMEYRESRPEGVLNSNLGETFTSAPQERELLNPSSSLSAAWKPVPGSFGAGPSETPTVVQPNVESFEMVLQKLHTLQSGRQKRPVDETYTSEYVQDDSMPSKKPSASAEEVNDSTTDLPGDGHEETMLLKELSLPKEDEKTMPPDSYQGNTELVQTIRELKERTVALEKKQLASEFEIKHLKNAVKVSCTLVEKLKDYVEDLETKLSPVGFPSIKFEHCLHSNIYLLGGYNGTSWLSTLESFSPSRDMIRPLKSMNGSRSYASTATLNGNIYVFGGGDGTSWFDSVECYNPSRDEWAWCPSLIRPKGSLAGATFCSKIFAIGGGDGNECFSDVEMLDLALGKWINVQPMLQKRFAPAAAELNNAIYTVGGYDGKAYLQSLERYDPREAKWTRLSDMTTRRGCLSLAVLNEKLYAMGGYDGEQMVSSVEVFDPRAGTWMMDMPMPTPRGYSAAAVLGDSLFVIGGVQNGQNILDSVECYKEGSGWAVTGLKAVGKRSFLSAAVL